MELSKFIDVNINNEGGVIRWIRERDGTHGSFIVPPCFSFRLFLKNMHKDKAEYHIKDDFAKNGTIMATVINSDSGVVMFSYEFLVKKTNEIIQ